MIVRFAKRRSAWESTSALEIVDVEFRRTDGSYDLVPSVYKLQVGDLIRALAEHAASAPIEIPTASHGIEFTSNTLEMRKTPGSKKFEFICNHHYEILAQDKEGLIKIVADFLGNKVRTIHNISKSDVIGYAQQRMRCQDPEWKRVVEESPNKKWLKALVPAKEAIKAAESALEA